MCAAASKMHSRHGGLTSADGSGSQLTQLNADAEGGTLPRQQAGSKNGLDTVTKRTPQALLSLREGSRVQHCKGRCPRRILLANKMRSEAGINPSLVSAGAFAPATTAVTSATVVAVVAPAVVAVVAVVAVAVEAPLSWRGG